MSGLAVDSSEGMGTIKSSSTDVSVGESGRLEVAGGGFSEGFPEVDE